jgi:hypothetical protein
MGGEPAHRTNPQLGGPGFSVRVISLGVPTPLLQGNKICNPRQGPLQGAISRSQPNPVFFFEVVTPPPPFSTGLGTSYGGVGMVMEWLIFQLSICGKVWNSYNWTSFCIWILKQNCVTFLYRHAIRSVFLNVIIFLFSSLLKLTSDFVTSVSHQSML